MIKSDYEKYIEHYVKGAKKISVRSKTLQLNLKEIDLKVKKSFGNYDLFFNKVGKLMHSVHYENEHSSKVLYAYDENDLLLTEIQLQSITNRLISNTTYLYDENYRIKSIICKREETSVGSFVFTEETRVYDGLKVHIIFRDNLSSSNSENDKLDKLEIFLTYNEDNLIIEDKGVVNEKELSWWNKNEYDLNGNIRFEYSLDNNGEIDGVYTFLEELHGISTGFKFKDKDLEFVRLSEFQFNERSHWIAETSFLNGEPRYIYERIIDYY
jgi:hypothetical protein